MLINYYVVSVIDGERSLYHISNVNISNVIFFRNRIISESCDAEDPDKTGSLKRQNSKTRMRDLALRHRISQE